MNSTRYETLKEEIGLLREDVEAMKEVLKKLSDLLITEQLDDLPEDEE
jgi:hypothetical protein